MTQKEALQHLLTDWREHGSVLVRFNGYKNGWEVKVNGKILKVIFINERAAVRFGLAHSTQPRWLEGEMSMHREWISVERLLPERFLPHFPEQSENVLIARKGSARPREAFYRFDRQGWFHPCFSLLELCGVTHWMPLPEMPREVC